MLQNIVISSSQDNEDSPNNVGLAYSKDELFSPVAPILQVGCQLLIESYYLQSSTFDSA